MISSLGACVLGPGHYCDGDVVLHRVAPFRSSMAFLDQGPFGQESVRVVYRHGMQEGVSALFNRGQS